MKEDVLEQVVDDYLKFNGYFTIHNVGFRPRSSHPDYVGSQDSVRSDVDVVGYHPMKTGVERTVVASCKAWQKWSEAFRAKVSALTGEATFSYRVAVARLRGDTDAWARDPTIAANMSGCSVGFLPLEEMWGTMLSELTTTPAASEIGRLVQLLKAAGLTDPSPVAAPASPGPRIGGGCARRGRKKCGPSLRTCGSLPGRASGLPPRATSESLARAL